MNPIRLLIVDDEPLAHQVLQRYCDKIDYVEVVGNCYDAFSTLNFLNEHPVDALLLDIQMPDLSGLELLESLRNPDLKVIFTTAYTEYALQGFDYDQVVDYLHKPVRITRFVKALERLKKQLVMERAFREQAPAVMEPELAAADFIALKDQGTVHRIHFEAIDYVQSWGNYLKFFLGDGQVKVIRGTIKDLEQKLPDRHFQRIHKSYLVNVHKVSALEGNQVVLPAIKLPLGKSYALMVKKKIFPHL